MRVKKTKAASKAALKRKPKKQSKLKVGLQDVEELKIIREQRKYSEQRYIDLTTAEGAELITKSACWRPDIYLDSMRTCDNCYIHETCMCPIKRFKNKKLNKFKK